MTQPREGEHIPAYATTEPGAIVFLPEYTDRDAWTEDEVYAFLSGQNPLEGPFTAGLEHAFHLPGQHDQSTHGSAGVRGHDALDAATIGIGSDGSVRGGYLQPEEYSALTAYRNTAYIRINDHLRGKTPVRPDDVADAAVKAAAIKSAMAKSPLKQKITVERGTRSDHWLPREFQDGKGNLTGLEFRDAGFVSVSARSGAGKGFAHKGGVVMTVTAPAGTKAIQLSDFGDEAEILLDSGLIFRVTADNGMIDGMRHIDVEVVEM